MSAFASLADIAPLPIWRGILARVAQGRDITFAVVELDAHATAARHQHSNEQLGLVLRGTITFVIGDETQALAAGDTYVIPSDVPHEATAGAEGAVVIDVFTPVRADWQRIAPEPARTPIWP